MTHYYPPSGQPQYVQQQQHPHPVVYSTQPQSYGTHPQPVYPPHHAAPYGAHPQPTYQPHHIQAQWSHDQEVQQYAYSGSPQPPPHSLPQSTKPFNGIIFDHELADLGQEQQASPYHGAQKNATEYETHEKFAPAPKYNDRWAMFAFFAQMIGFGVLSAYAIYHIIQVGFTKSGDDDDSIAERDFFLTPDVWVTFAFGIAGIVVYSYVFLLITHIMPLFSMLGTYWFILLGLYGFTGYFIYQVNIASAVFFGFFGICFTVYYVGCHNRIRASAILLKEVTAISKRTPAVFLVSFIGLFFQILCNIHILVVITGIRQMVASNDSSSTASKLHALLHTLAYFSFYWLSQVLTNIVHVTLSGVFATDYFQTGSPSPTMSSLKRACTTSFGTICFGGLIYAIVQTIKKILDFLRGDGSHCLACFFECCFHWINEGLAYINPLVYCEVAIYGTPFLDSAKDAYKIVKDRGMDEVHNRVIISTVWSIGAFFGALITGALCQIMQIMFTAGAVVHSGVATFFIAIAEDPDQLARSKPKMYAKIQVAYPDMLESD
ncbi:putative choline transporter, neither null mutation nor overexpression affects choline transport [Podila humilis]|nr:putative choline transporter, neither null mutation nor overexpression affects choline transport [Podila humilis]